MTIQAHENRDRQLVATLRAGRTAAMAELYERHQVGAHRVARLVSQEDPDELVSEAFTRVFAAIEAGAGPRENFPAYLHTTIRHLNVDRVQAASRERAASDQQWLFDQSTEAIEPAPEMVDHERAASALKTLPDRWQGLLWMLEVEGLKPAEVARRTAMPVSRVSATAYRAREGLRRAFLQQHLSEPRRGGCGWTQERLAAHVRGGLSLRATSKIDAHIDVCTACAAEHRALLRVNDKLGATWWPYVLLAGVAAAAPSLLPAGSSLTAGAGVAAVRPRASGPSRWLSFGQTGAFGASAGVVGTAVAAVAVAAAVVVGVSAWTGEDSLEQESSRIEAVVVPERQVVPRTPGPSAGGVREDEPVGPVAEEANPVAAAESVSPGPDEAGPVLHVVPGIAVPVTPDPEPIDPEPVEPDPVDPVEQEPGPQTVALGLDDPVITPTGGVLGLSTYRIRFPITATDSMGDAPFTLMVTWSFDERVWLRGEPSNGWDCGSVDTLLSAYGRVVLPGQQRTCTYPYVPGQDVTDLEFAFASWAARPSGTVEIAGTGHAAGSASTGASKRF